MVRKAVTTAIRMSAVCSAPTWVKNAAVSTMENGAGASAPGTAASRRRNLDPGSHVAAHLSPSKPSGPGMESSQKDETHPRLARLAAAARRWVMAPGRSI
jgi:hypothetical protein